MNELRDPTAPDFAMDMPPDVEQRAGTALWMGVGALAAAAVGPFFCYMPYFIALPLGGWSAWSAWKGMREAEGAPALVRSCFTVGLIAGGGAFLGALFFLGLLFLVMLFYIVIIIVAIASGNAS